MMCCNDNSEQAWRWELNKASKCETTFQKHFACFDITKTKLFLKKQFRDPKLKKSSICCESGVYHQHLQEP